MVNVLRTSPMLLLSLFVLLTVLPFLEANIARGLLAFLITPLLIVYGNKHHLWFRQSLRWMVRLSHKLVLCLGIFFIGVLVSYELLQLLHPSIGYALHLILLSVSTIIYWAPLLLSCPFDKPRPFADRAAYYSLATALFILYHHGTFVYYDGMPTLPFMFMGMTVMMGAFLYLFIQWFRSEQHVDRPTVKGYVVSLQNKNNL
ncbi:hypothetical protein [Halobacillus sp. Marseille-Q1614]|uniref:hypothetical protein n=1 Tax=Halobacillus sp. Marseille-Q1614 TaxID=2709134 RepID=UPI00156D63CD|nr:hypothetical protein [Halobacillus sp. Marseille-Q1614]